MEKNPDISTPQPGAFLNGKKEKEKKIVKSSNENDKKQHTMGIVFRLFL